MPDVLPGIRGTEILGDAMTRFRFPFRITGLRVSVPSEGLGTRGTGFGFAGAHRIHVIFRFRDGLFHRGCGSQNAQAAF